jgi:hypothetical protein
MLSCALLLPLQYVNFQCIAKLLQVSTAPTHTSSMVFGVLPRLMVSLYWYMGFWQAAGQQESSSQQAHTDDDDDDDDDDGDDAAAAAADDDDDE